jgi:hypothetical protein
MNANAVDEVLRTLGPDHRAFIPDGPLPAMSTTVRQTRETRMATMPSRAPGRGHCGHCGHFDLYEGDY